MAGEVYIGNGVDELGSSEVDSCIMHVQLIVGIIKVNISLGDVCM